uniref:Uncharacterized protein n=1 Tax=Lepeophtheirus salmonis TaxID=72036 RepID=A0A0K2VLJ9_LEPSM
MLGACDEVNWRVLEQLALDPKRTINICYDVCRVINRQIISEELSNK